MTAKRWQDREQRWIAPGELFDARRFSVDVIEGDKSDTIAKRFVVQHHYAGTFPAARLNVGLYGPGAQLVGVAVFSQPMTNAVLAKYGGTHAATTCELGRFVCTPDVAYNGETWMLARAFRFVREAKGVDVVLSCADPMEWRAGSLVIKPQHFGVIYQAANALYAGRTYARWHHVAPNGRPISPRALSKVRTGDRGREYAERLIVAAGCTARRPFEEGTDWIKRLERTGELRKERHDGNLAYVFGLTPRARSHLIELHGRRPYPKRSIAHEAA